LFNYFERENYYILSEYTDVVLPPFIVTVRGDLNLDSPHKREHLATRLMAHSSYMNGRFYHKFN
jgi:hypothetical protein